MRHSFCSTTYGVFRIVCVPAWLGFSALNGVMPLERCIVCITHLKSRPLFLCLSEVVTGHEDTYMMVDSLYQLNRVPILQISND